MQSKLGSILGPRVPGEELRKRGLRYALPTIVRSIAADGKGRIYVGASRHPSTRAGYRSPPTSIACRATYARWIA